MRKTPLMMCCSAALVLAVAGCDANRTDDTLADQDQPAVIDPATRPIDTAPPVDPTPPPAAATMLSVATGADGQYLTDNQGRAVYLLEGDTDGSKCTAACLAAWPPVQSTVGAAGTAGTAATSGPQAGLRTDRVGTTQRADGTSQVTYNGHPLYRYAKDTGSLTTGHDVTDQWGEWYLVTPEGDALEGDEEA